MDVAITIFRVGVGVGAVLVGLGIVFIALSLRPLARDARALANDARRLTNLAENELGRVIRAAREMTSGAEIEADELAERLNRLNQRALELEERVGAHAALPVGSGRSAPAALSVQSPHAGEDERIA